MNKTALFNAISNIDDGILEKYADAASALTDAKTKKRKLFIKIVSVAAALTLVAGMVFGAVMIKNAGFIIGPSENPEKALSAGGLFTLRVSRDDVIYDHGDELPAPPEKYKYVFSKPEGEGLKYTGLYISEKVKQALQFNGDGTFSYYILKDKSTYKYKFDGYYNVKDGQLTAYLIQEELAGVCKIENHGDRITLKPENDAATDFNKSDNALKADDNGYNGPDFKNALDFRNIPWKYEAENLDISFGGNFSLVFYDWNTMTRTDAKFEWNEASNTVTIPDWHTPKGADWTGRIEDGSLVLTSGGSTITLYDPAKKKQENSGLYFPFDTYLAAGDRYYSDLKIMFRSNKIYEIGYYNKEDLSFHSLYSGEYGIESPDDFINGQCIRITPSGEPSEEYLSYVVRGGYQGSELRRFADLCEADGEKFIINTTENGGYTFTRMFPEGTIVLTLYPAAQFVE